MRKNLCLLTLCVALSPLSSSFASQYGHYLQETAICKVHSLENSSIKLLENDIDFDLDLFWAVGGDGDDAELRVKNIRLTDQYYLQVTGEPTYVSNHPYPGDEDTRYVRVSFVKLENGEVVGLDYDDLYLDQFKNLFQSHKLIESFGPRYGSIDLTSVPAPAARAINGNPVKAVDRRNQIGISVTCSVKP